MKPIDAIDLCPVCGTTLPGGPLEGVCAVCLLDSSIKETADPRSGTEASPYGPLPRHEGLPWHFGRYLIKEEISRGAVGVVFRASDEALHREVAVKFLHAGPSASQEAVRRLFMEARAATRLRHPHIVPIYEVGGGDDGQPFLVMPFMEGGRFPGRSKAGSPEVWKYPHGGRFAGQEDRPGGTSRPSTRSFAP